MKLFRRDLEASLEKWIKDDQRKPLLIRGARQVGKSTMVRKLVDDHGYSLIEINLEKHHELNEVFASFNVKAIVREIEAVVSKKISKDINPLLFLDEIQATPAAIAALRYFYEEMGWLPVIAAGSLLEFALAEFSYSMPVGRVEYRYLGPLKFHEYLAAAGEDYLLTCLQSIWQEGISATAHKALLKRQREYLFIGGMPEVVATFISSEDFQRCQDIQGDLLETFKEDFAKYSTGSKRQRLQRVFSVIPGQLGQKVKYTNLSKDEKAREVKESVFQLIQAQLCYPVFHSDCSGLPLEAGQDENVYKLIFLDVGLMNRALNLEWQDIKNLDERSLVNEGPIAEQFIGQELLYWHNGRVKPQLNYWLRDGKAHNAEVDYVIADGSNLMPIEVKSGKSGTLRSLKLFCELKGIKSAVRFDLNPPSKQNIELANGCCLTLQSLPLYCASFLSQKLRYI